MDKDMTDLFMSIPPVVNVAYFTHVLWTERSDEFIYIIREKSRHALHDYSKRYSYRAWSHRSREDNRIICTKVCSFSHFSCCLSLSHPLMRSHCCCCCPTGTMHLHNQSSSVIPAHVAPPIPTLRFSPLCLLSPGPISPPSWWCQGKGRGRLLYVQITMEGGTTWPLNLNLTQWHVCSVSSRLNHTASFCLGDV